MCTPTGMRFADKAGQAGNIARHVAESGTTFIPGMGGTDHLKKESHQAKSGRRKLWQIDSHFLCSIIGTCLTLGELRQIAVKAGLPVDNDISDYEIHSYFVNNAHDQCLRLVHKHLEKKFKRQITAHARLQTEEELLNVWGEVVASGNIPGAYWSLVTHSRATKKVLTQLFGDVHMLSHISGATVRTDIKKLGELQDKLKTVEKDFKDLEQTMRQRLEKKQKELERLEDVDGDNIRLREALAAAQARVAELEQADRQVQLEEVSDNLATQLHVTTLKARKASNRIGTLNTQLQEHEQKIRELQLNLKQVEDEKSIIETTFSQWLSSASQCDSKSEKTDCFCGDLKGKKILFVGGHPHQSSYLRSVVELNNGSFIYHDGGKEQNVVQLTAALSQADVVFCPLNYVSHDAYYRAKKYCKQTCKQLVMLPQASLAAFISGLSNLAAA